MLLTSSSKAILLLLSMIIRITATGNHCYEISSDQNTDGIDTCNHFIIPSGTSVTWDEPMSGTWDELIIENGATLTITSQLYMLENTFINVKRGGKLVVDGGMISGTCGQWGGINVWGTFDQPQTQEYQGLAEVINGGAITNAECGIRAVRMIPDPDGQGYAPDLAYTGGIIWADNASFINNQTAVQFYSYPDYGSTSHFYRTTFQTNDELKGGEIPDYFIKMSGIYGINIKGCEFSNTRLEGECPFSERGSGIFSAGSNYFIQEFESGGQTWTTAFEGLNYGIRALAVSSDMTISVKNSQFNNNYRSIYLSGIPQAEVTGNEFLCRDVPEMYDSYGLYLDGCSGYDVWENYFYSENENGESIGLIVNNSNLTGDENNLIYDNYFYQLDYAALAQNANRSFTGYPGLQFKCNDFTDNNQDLAVTYEGELTHWMGIAAEQGSGEENITAPAGNRFSYAGSLEEPTDINNQALQIDYWYHDPNYNLRLIPQYFSEETVTLRHNDQPWNEETCCPPLYGSGGGGGSEELMGEMTEATFKADSISVVIQTLEDGGSTEALKWDVDMSAPPQATDIYNDLMSRSPYVSDSVMESAVEKENVLVDAMIRDIMVSNPESAKNDELIEGLEQRTNPPPAYMMGQILEGRSLVSVYGALKSQHSFYRLKQSIAFKKLARYYLTTYPDSLMVLLSGTKGLSNAYNLAFMHLANGNVAAGSNLLTSLPGLYNLSSDDLEVYDNMVDYFNLIAQSGLSIPDSNTIQALVSMINKPGLAAVYARNRLLEVDEIQYKEPVLLPDPLKSGKNADKYEVYMAASGSIKRLEAYPNPAAGLVILSWHLEFMPKNASLVVTGIDGKTLLEIPVTDRENKEVIDTNDLLPGVYIATLYIDGKQLESIKFSISR